MAKTLGRFVGLGLRYRFALLVLLGLLAALGQAPNDLWPVSIVALAAVLAIHSTAVSPRQASFYGWSVGLGYFGFSLRWIIEPFLIDLARHGWMAPFAIVFMASGAALFWALASYVAARLAPRSLFMLALCLVWVEIARSLILTGFPWALLGHIWVPTWLAQAAGFGGPHFLTLLTVLAAYGAAQFFFGRRVMGVLIGAGFFAVAFALVPPEPNEPIAEAPIVRIVQPNAPQHQKWDPAFRNIFLRRLLDLSAQGTAPDLVVWPETAIPSLLHYVEADTSVLVEAAQGAPLVFGIQRVDDQDRFYNSLVVLNGNGEITDLYDKSHLVPFGEYIPGGRWAAQFGVSGLADVIGGGFTPGQGSDTVFLPGIGAAVPLICYEGIFAEEIARPVQRPRLLVLITNDAWFGQAAGPYQHLAQARLRAIEQGLPMVRAANTGISAVIDAHGRIVQSIPLGHAGAMDLALPRVLPMTLYAKWGDRPILLLLVLLTFGAYWGRLRNDD
ncbi:apolipoprotein N-acyltransferase [Yoonia sediminilitoris]|uniref:Apolipoprotein N-acyltransferase n=1 Tax=Yoonia sediminilitoris TaxID=1286148 RepID=A0A2T6KJR9_9RHOB|nr:apolipoprotein N-acyltransferase [Yoonia sediminilitoris]PUB16214.1 apolipoprotein N-acyltransferase [Yoonia sediminilitoris]RCW96563.1 apolipoprotein N-acyltransferase [Yoonia sediminilitoris]